MLTIPVMKCPSMTWRDVTSARAYAWNSTALYVHLSPHNLPPARLSSYWALSQPQRRNYHLCLTPQSAFSATDSHSRRTQCILVYIVVFPSDIRFWTYTPETAWICSPLDIRQARTLIQSEGTQEKSKCFFFDTICTGLYSCVLFC
jgi:hypothetical protein